MKSKKKIALALTLTAVISVTATYAAMLLTYPITTHLTVKPLVSMSVFEPDGVTHLTHVELGQFEHYTTKYFPGGGSTPPTQYYYINNTDQMTFYVDFLWTDLPPNSPSLFVWIKRGDQASFQQFSACDTTHSDRYKVPIMTPLEDPDPAKQYAVWYFKFDVQNPPFGDYNPTLTISAWETASG